MGNYAHDLFLLTTTLSQLKEKEPVIKLFIESMNDIFHGYAFEWFNEKAIDVENSIEVCTRNKNYGFLSFKTKDKIDSTIFE